MFSGPQTEFRQLMQIAGWTQAETARQIGMTSSGVNHIYSGKVDPSPVTLKLMRLLCAGAEQTPKWIQPLKQELETIPPESREIWIRAAIDQLRAIRSR